MAFETCMDCPFVNTAFKQNDVVWIKCGDNNKKVGVIDKKGYAEGRGDIKPPKWCPYNVEK